MRVSRIVAVMMIAIVASIAFASQAARLLVVDDPVKSDAIVVLAGETNSRPAHALDLLHAGFAQHVFLDAEQGSLIYDELLVDIARRYIEARGGASRVSVCPVFGSSTFAEVDDASRCLQAIGAHRVLIVTSEFHTRRALMIFRHRLPQYEIHVAAAYSPFQFGEKWWTNREWAKTTFDEWIKMTWFEIADRWR
jgi:vancomycin permeability regulator SanA